MLGKVKEYIVKHRLVDSGDLIIMGISGGPDSMALLYIMKELQKELGFKVVAAHLNHCLREEAEAEEQFVSRCCQSWEVPFYSRRVNIRQVAEQEKKSEEEAGRDCRYQFFRQLKAELGGQLIATAHHQDDSAETVLLHLLRGSGIKGLRGIMPQKDSIIRPLLGITKKEIEDYLQQKAIKYCIDKSNYDTTYLRNRIRYQLIPYLQKAFNPRIVESLNQLAQIAREENDILESEANRHWNQLIIRQNKASVVLDNKRLLELHPAYQSRLIFKALNELKGETGWDYTDIQIVRDLAGKSGSSRRVQLKKGVRAAKVYNQLTFTLKAPEKIDFCYKVEIPGRIIVEETGEAYDFNLVNKKDMIPGGSYIYLDYDRLEQPLFLRSRRPGDYFAPAGMTGRKKIKDFFIDIKLPVQDRDKVALLASSGQIYALLGFRLSRLAAIDRQTNRFLVIKRKALDQTN